MAAIPKFFINRQEAIPTMKQITATVPASRKNAVVDAINDIVGGFTITEGKGRGSSKRQTVKMGRGTGSMTADYNEIVSIATIVPDADVPRVSDVIAGAAYTGNPGDGIIAVTDVDSVMNITTKKSGESAL